MEPMPVKHDITLLERIAGDVASSHAPDDSYTHEMTAMWHRMNSELAVFRREVPDAYVAVPVSTDGMPEATEPRHTDSAAPDPNTAPKPNIQGEDSADEVPHDDEWSDAAREAAAEARRAGAKGPQPSAGDDHRVAAKASAKQARGHAQALRKAADAHPEAKAAPIAAKAEEHAHQAAEHARAAGKAHDPAMAEHHAAKAAEHAGHAERAHGEAKEHAEHASHGGGSFWLSFLKMLTGKKG